MHHAVASEAAVIQHKWREGTGQLFGQVIKVTSFVRPKLTGDKCDETNERTAEG